MSLSFIDYNEEMRMEGQCTSFLSKMMPGRFYVYVVLVCLYTSQECSLGLGNGGLLQDLHCPYHWGPSSRTEHAVLEVVVIHENPNWYPSHLGTSAEMGCPHVNTGTSKRVAKL